MLLNYRWIVHSFTPRFMDSSSTCGLPIRLRVATRVMKAGSTISPIWTRAALWMINVMTASTRNTPNEYALKDEKASMRLYEIATDATLRLIKLYQTQPELFRKITLQATVLPCLLSIHPDSRNFVERYLRFSELGRQSNFSAHVNRRPYFEPGSWPLKYADNILTAIQLEQDSIRGWMHDRCIPAEDVFKVRIESLKETQGKSEFDHTG